MHNPLTARGASVAALTMGEPNEVTEFCGQRAPGVRCLSDPDQHAYRAYGLDRASTRALLTPDILVQGVRAALAGHHVGAVVGDPRQMPGTFVIGSDGRVRMAYYSRTIADHPATERIFASLDGA